MTTWWGPHFPDAASGGGGGGGPVFPAITNGTTPGAIRDRIITVIEALTPTVLTADRFRRYRNEGAADFIAWAETNPAGALRRFQVRDDGGDVPPEVSNTDVEEHVARFTILIAYPQTSRAGAKNALDRDTAMRDDQRDIIAAVGMAGRFNFTPVTNASYPDAVWRSGTSTRQAGAGCDYLVIEQTMAYRLDLT